MLNSCRMNIGYMYLIELIPSKNQKLIGTIFRVFDVACIVLAATFWFKYVETDWFVFVSFGLYFQIFSCIAVLFLPESPVYLLKRNRYSELRDALKRIASWNGVKELPSKCE